MNDYRLKLRSSPKQQLSNDNFLLPGMSADDLDFSYIPSFTGSPSPQKNKPNEYSSPHKSGYFLRSPSPMRKLHNFLLSPSKSPRNDIPGTPSRNKPSSATDLFGNKSLLENLDVPEDWDENFLSNFQDDWLMAIGAEDLESLGKSPLKSPGRGQTFMPGSTRNTSPSVSPFKSPLLTSSPKRSSGLSPLCWGKTPVPMSGARPVTRQRKLFSHSPEKQGPSHGHTSNSSNVGPAWNAPLPFTSLLDASSSSILSDGLETTSSFHSISSYLKNLDDDEVQEELSVMPPAGWTSSKSGSKVSRAGKGGGKAKREKKTNAPSQKSPSVAQPGYQRNSHSGGGKKMKIEPQFTLLHPHTDLGTHQISLRTAPVTPPNKVKISRDFSQIQTLPSKEQLRIVRNRFTETLNKAVEEVIEKEKSKTRASRSMNPIQTSTITPSFAPQSGTNPIAISPTQSIQQLPPIQCQYLAPPTGFTMQMPHTLPMSTLPSALISVKPPPPKRRKH